MRGIAIERRPQTAGAGAAGAATAAVGAAAAVLAEAPAPLSAPRGKHPANPWASPSKNAVVISPAQTPAPTTHDSCEHTSPSASDASAAAYAASTSAFELASRAAASARNHSSC